MPRIFVFGSNRLGIHKRGAALYAMQNHGAIYGQGEGFQGNSYALPTKANPATSLSLEEIYLHIKTFETFAKSHPDLVFHVTRIGCGLAGYSDEEIAPLFLLANHKNIEYPPEWALKFNYPVWTKEI